MVIRILIPRLVLMQFMMNQNNDLNKDPAINDGRNVVKHFNLKNLCFKDHFRFFIFKKVIEDLFDRLNIETQLIHLFIKLKFQF